MLVLDTRFPRVAGDAGFGGSWEVPVIYEQVSGASARRTVEERARGLLPDFIRAGLNLVKRGADGICTTCGFLAVHQRALSDALPVPVLSSALLSGPRLLNLMPPDHTLGILTASVKDLSSEHLQVAGINPSRTVVGGPRPDSPFARALLQNHLQFDLDAARQEMADAARTLCGKNKVGALLLECANMPPYAAAVQQASGIHTYSLTDAVLDFYQSLLARGKRKA